MSSFTLRKRRFCERRMFKQKTISCEVRNTSYQKRCIKVSETSFNLVLDKNTNCYCQSCFVKNVLPFVVNESLRNNQNQSRNSLINITSTPNS